MKPRLLIVLVLILFSACASLEKKYAKASSAELKLRHHQLEDAIGSGGFSFKFGHPLAMAMMGDKREDRIKEKQEIEFELLRRYKAGDEDAKLPFFE